MFLSGYCVSGTLLGVPDFGLLTQTEVAEVARRVGGDGSAIYRPTGRISRPAALLSMVEYCSVELKLQLFPEDIQAVAAVLQRDHYRFKSAP